MYLYEFHFDIWFLKTLLHKLHSTPLFGIWTSLKCLAYLGPLIYLSHSLQYTLAATTNMDLDVPKIISGIFHVSFAGGTSGSQCSYRHHYNGHMAHSPGFGAESLCVDLYLLCVQTSHSESMLHVCWLAHLEQKLLSLQFVSTWVIACSDICHAPPSGACLTSPCSCKPQYSAGTAPLPPLCAASWHVWSDLTYELTFHNTHKQQTCCQVHLENQSL